jgi:hypothetical protein
MALVRRRTGTVHKRTAATVRIGSEMSAGKGPRAPFPARPSGAQSVGGAGNVNVITFGPALETEMACSSEVRPAVEATIR